MRYATQGSVVFNCFAWLTGGIVVVVVLAFEIVPYEYPKTLAWFSFLYGSH